MQVEFVGAVGGNVTGSRHIVHTENARILLDCGLFQGRRSETIERNRRAWFSGEGHRRHGAVARAHRPFGRPSPALPPGFPRIGLLHTGHAGPLRGDAGGLSRDSGPGRRLHQSQDRKERRRHEARGAALRPERRRRDARAHGQRPVPPTPTDRSGGDADVLRRWSRAR